MEHISSRAFSIPTAVAAATLVASMPLFKKNHLQVSGKHVYITGASEGLGYALAQILVERGANVTIVARTQSKLDTAVEALTSKCSRRNQKIGAISADLTDLQQSTEAFDKACAERGVPDVVFSCVGGAAGILGIFTETTPEQGRKAMDLNYFATFWTTQVAAKRMAEAKVSGKIVLVSSVAGLLGFAGYSLYTPAKMAIRGLAESLRNELLMHGISVHCYFPATILSPGLEAENKTKPAITFDIEGADEGQTPEVCAAKLVRGLERNHCFITSDFLGDLFRNTMRGVVPTNNAIWDFCLFLIAPLVVFVWRPIVDGKVKKLRHRAS